MNGGRPYTVLSVAMSLDGRIDDGSPDRLVLSSAADIAAVDALRAWSDAIIVGAGTVRADDPRLRIRDPERIARRVEAGRRAQPLRVVLGACFPDSARVNDADDPDGLIVLSGPVTGRVSQRLPGVASAAAVAPRMHPDDVLDQLARRDVTRVLVEGGTGVFTDFLNAGVVDELRLAVAPFAVGGTASPRFLGDTVVAPSPDSPARLLGIESFDGVVVAHYGLTERARSVTHE